MLATNIRYGYRRSRQNSKVPTKWDLNKYLLHEDWRPLLNNIMVIGQGLNFKVNISLWIFWQWWWSNIILRWYCGGYHGISNGNNAISPDWQCEGTLGRHFWENREVSTLSSCSHTPWSCHSMSSLLPANTKYTPTVRWILTKLKSILYVEYFENCFEIQFQKHFTWLLRRGLSCWGNPGVCLQSETHDMSFATKALDSTIGCNPGKDPK